MASTLQVNPQMNGPGGETKIQLPQGTYTLTARRNNPESPEQAETTVTVPDHDISGVVLQFAPIPSIPVELIVDSSVTSDNNASHLRCRSWDLCCRAISRIRTAAILRCGLTTRRDQSFVFTAPPGSYRLQSRNAGRGISNRRAMGMLICCSRSLWWFRELRGRRYGWW